MISDLIKLLGEVILSWFTFKNKGNAVPDSPEDPVITDGADATNQQIISNSLKK